MLLYLLYVKITFSYTAVINWINLSPHQVSVLLNFESDHKNKHIDIMIFILYELYIHCRLLTHPQNLTIAENFPQFYIFRQFHNLV